MVVPPVSGTDTSPHEEVAVDKYITSGTVLNCVEALPGQRCHGRKGAATDAISL
jgi:hypothetical protein